MSKDFRGWVGGLEFTLRVTQNQQRVFRNVPPADLGEQAGRPGNQAGSVAIVRIRRMGWE